MEGVGAKEANRFYAANNYINQMGQTCFEKCVVDFQQKDISAMEKECAKACIAKHLTIFKDVIKPDQH